MAPFDVAAAIADGRVAVQEYATSASLGLAALDGAPALDRLAASDAAIASLDAMNDLAPLARVLGFTSIESYVTWKRLEPDLLHHRLAYRFGYSSGISTTLLGI